MKKNNVIFIIKIKLCDGQLIKTRTISHAKLAVFAFKVKETSAQTKVMIE